MCNLKSPNSKLQTIIKNPNIKKAQIKYYQKSKYDKKPKFKAPNYNKKPKYRKSQIEFYPKPTLGKKFIFKSQIQKVLIQNAKLQ
jgi:hypothetical protein